jgi:hypothetical protein
VQNSVTEQIQFSTPPDPRHDSYDVCLLQGQLWLERSWSMTLVEGASMQHTCTRFYRMNNVNTLLQAVQQNSFSLGLTWNLHPATVADGVQD